MKISFQNVCRNALVLAEQDSGQLPLYLGPSLPGVVSEVELTPVQFLSYIDRIDKLCTNKKESHGLGRLLIDNAVISCAELVVGMSQGHLGDAAKELADAYIQRKSDEAERAKVADAERKASMQVALGRSL
jgi:hypothetical protein